MISPRSTTKRRSRSGELNPNSRLVLNDIIAIVRDVVENGSAQTDVARRHGITPPHVSMILAGKLWPRARAAIVRAVPGFATWRRRRVLRFGSYDGACRSCDRSDCLPFSECRECFARRLTVLGLGDHT